MKYVANSEGGYSNDPKDKGGITYKGISSKFYQGLIRDHGYPNKPVTMITEKERLAIYRRWFWNPLARHHANNPALALQLFDHSVNSGVTRANELLKKGNITPRMYRNARKTAYVTYDTCKAHCGGWLPRVDYVYNVGLKLKGMYNES